MNEITIKTYEDLVREAKIPDFDSDAFFKEKNREMMRPSPARKRETKPIITDMSDISGSLRKRES